MKTFYSAYSTGAKNLNSIELSENKISTLKEGTFDDVKQEELKVELYDNEFNCDCKLQWFKKWHDKVNF